MEKLSHIHIKMTCKLCFNTTAYNYKNNPNVHPERLGKMCYNHTMEYYVIHMKYYLKRNRAARTSKNVK